MGSTDQEMYRKTDFYISKIKAIFLSIFIFLAKCFETCIMGAKTMIWMVKQLIYTGFCVQTIKGQKCPTPAKVMSELKKGLGPIVQCGHFRGKNN